MRFVPRTNVEILVKTALVANVLNVKLLLTKCNVLVLLDQLVIHMLAVSQIASNAQPNQPRLQGTDSLASSQETRTRTSAMPESCVPMDSASRIVIPTRIVNVANLA